MTAAAERSVRVANGALRNRTSVFFFSELFLFIVISAADRSLRFGPDAGTNR